MTYGSARWPDETRNMANIVRWLDEVDFMVYPIRGTTWNDVPGVYIFAGQRWPGGLCSAMMARRLSGEHRSAIAFASFVGSSDGSYLVTG